VVAAFHHHTLKEGELIPSNDTLVSLGVTARVACAIMLRTRDELVDMHDHDSIDEMMTSIDQASESLKWITHMVDTAYVRILTSASAHLAAGGEAERERRTASS
jgi:hypothetical protein